MATQVQIRRGTSSQVAAFTGAEGEIVVNTTNDSVHIHDGSSAGGFEMARADLNNVSDTDLNAALTGNTVSALTVTALTSSGIEISGAVTATASDTNPAIFASTSGSNFTDLFLRHASSSFTNAVRLRAVSDGLAIFTSDVQERIRVLSTGLVGIGTSSPATLLELSANNNGAASNNTLRFTDTDTTTQANQQIGKIEFFSKDSSGDGALVRGFINCFSEDATPSAAISFATNPGGVGNTTEERMRIDSNGNVGIGTVGSGASSATPVELNLGSTFANSVGSLSKAKLKLFEDSSANVYGLSVSNGLLEFGAPTGASHAFFIGESEKMRIDSSGNLLVGKTSTSASETGHRFGQSGTYVAVTNFTGTNEQAIFNQDASTGTTQIDFRNENVARGFIEWTNTATTYNTTSDRRMKENIQDADDAGSNIDAIQVRKFDWIESGEHHPYGTIAQELQSIASYAVTGSEDSEKMMAVDYSTLVPMLIKEIQSLRARVQQLENN